MKKLKCRNKNTVLISITIIILLANTITLYITFLFAFINNGKITVTINSYNEMYFEFILLPLIIVLGFYVFYKIISRNLIISSKI